MVRPDAKRQRQSTDEDDDNDSVDEKSAAYWKKKYLEEKQKSCEWKQKYEDMKDYARKMILDDEDDRSYSLDDSYSEPCWHYLPEHAQNDKQLAIKAYDAERASKLKELPEELLADTTFVLEICDILALTCGTDVPLMMAEELPGILSKVAAWKYLLRNDYFILSLRANFRWQLVDAPEEIRSDGQLMLDAFEYHFQFMQQVLPKFAADEKFLNQAMKKNALVLAYLPIEAVTAFPNYVVEHLKDFFKECPDIDLEKQVWDLIGANIKAENGFAKVWLTAGGPFLKDRCPAAWRDDKQLFHWIVENRNFKYTKSALKCASRSVLGDKALMLKALEKYASNWELLSDRLKDDLEINALAFLSFGDRPGRYLPRDLKRKRSSVLSRIRDILGERHRFELISLGCLLAPGSNLAILNQGNETTGQLFKHIGEFAGVPFGKQLTTYRAALKSLERGVGSGEDTDSDDDTYFDFI